MAQTVKHLSTMRETWVRALGWEDPLEKEMAIHPSTIAWKIPWTEEPGRLQSMGSQRVRHNWATSLSLSVWTSRRSNQSILNEISPECSLEGLMLKLKLQYFDHLMRRSDSFVKTLIWERLKARGEGDDRGWNGWMTPLTQWTRVWVNSRS